MCVDVPWKVQVEDENVMNINGERKRNEKEEGEVKYIRMESRVEKFMRKFTDGVLTVTVPKLPLPELKKPKTIEVKME